MKRAAEVIVVESFRASARAARLTRAGDDVRVEAAADAAGADALEAARNALAVLGGRGASVRVIARDVTAACLELPPGSGALPPERLRELVRWEIEPLVPGAGELACAWSEAVRDRRLAVGIRGERLLAWRAAIPGLEALYPRVLPAAGFLAGVARGEGDGRGELRVVEARPDALGVVVVRDGALESVRVREPSGDVTAADVLELAGREAAFSLLGDVAGLSARSLARDAAILGAARHALGLGPSWLAAVAAREPALPLHRRPWAQAAAGGAVVLAALAALDASFTLTLRERRQQLEQLGRRPVMTLAVAAPEPRGKLEAEAAQLEAEEKTLERRRAWLEDQVLRNDGLALALLDGVARAADDDVALERVVQTRPGEWKLSGFALSDAAAQRFAAALGRALQPRGLASELLGVRGARGRLGVAGWSFEVSVARDAKGRP